jgi:hypothetical protein
MSLMFWGSMFQRIMALFMKKRMAFSVLNRIVLGLSWYNALVCLAKL